MKRLPIAECRLQIADCGRQQTGPWPVGPALCACLLLLSGCRIPLPAPESVVLKAPAAGTAVHAGNILFEWDSVASAESYELQVDDRASFYSPVFDTAGVAALSLGHFLADGQYYWRVRARSQDRVWGDWSGTDSFAVRTFRIAAQTRTRGYPQGLDVLGDYVYIADGEAGLSIYRAEPDTFVLAGSIMDTLNSCWGVAAAGHCAYLAYGRKQLQVVRIPTPDSMTFAGAVSYTTGYGYDVAALDSSYVIVANSGKATLFDVRDPEFPMLLYEPHAPSRGVAVRDTIAYLACEQLGLLIIRFSTSATPVTLGAVQSLGNARGVALSADYCLIADGRAGLTIVSIADPTVPRLVGGCQIPGGYANKVAVRGDTAYVAAGSAGLAAFCIADPANPVLLGVVKMNDAKSVLVTESGTILATDRDLGLLRIVREED
jgi:hypothetical protein